MKKLLLTLTILGSLSSISARFHAPEGYTETLGELNKEVLETLKNTPDIENYIAAYLVGNGLSIASFKAGNKFLPPMAIIPIGKYKIPLKAILNLLTSYGVGYGPLLAYSYTKNTPENK